jgi:hypothetical protein
MASSNRITYKYEVTVVIDTDNTLPDPSDAIDLTLDILDGQGVTLVGFKVDGKEIQD